MGSGTMSLATWISAYPPCFNPFQGFMGSGTTTEIHPRGERSRFQSLPGIYGVWHTGMAKLPISTTLFQSLPGIYGVWHISRVYFFLPCIKSFNPFQGFMGSGTCSLCLPRSGCSFSFNPFQGFMGSGTAPGSGKPCPGSSFNPFQGFMGSGTQHKHSCRFADNSLFQSLPGIYGVWHVR